MAETCIHSHCILLPIGTTGTQIIFALLFFHQGGNWAVYLLNTITISSMVREMLYGFLMGSDLVEDPIKRLAAVIALPRELKHLRKLFAARSRNNRFAQNSLAVALNEIPSN
ncbi:hypothetical protein QBC46DRAFT_407686 [Diplogelasinospora grovesii]|uniref:Uncharacterized protein n=1 Tax=Diplogelasinospora grovesii TaxID=303347 RepID=A0AAN6N894_9PEZI|nr:hypothetical protein QBC46DRAFT_407686 [Diplogelasinospora grovesii]